MKRTALILVTLALLVAPARAAKLRVVTATTDLASIVRAVAGDRVEVESIASGFQNPHAVDAKPSYIVKLAKADAMVRVGLGLDQWADTLSENARNPRILRGGAGYIDAAVGVPVLERPSGVDRSMGDLHAFGNPHYWLDPDNAKIVAGNIADRLAQLDPADGAAFHQGAADFSKRIDAALKGWMAKAKPLQGLKVISYHSSWAYFAHRFGLDVVGFVEPKPGISPSGAHLNDLIALMKRDGVRVIIKEPYFSRQAPDKLAAATGAKVVEMPPSVGGAPGVDDYFKLIDYDLDQLLAAVK